MGGEVAIEDDIDLVEDTGVTQLAIVIVAGLPGRIMGGEVVPGETGADFPEDGVEDQAIRIGGTAASPFDYSLAFARLPLRGREDGLEEGPLVVSEMHGSRQVDSFYG